jgi:hypothetical protein
VSLSHFDVSMDLFERRCTKEIKVMIDGDGVEGTSDVEDLPGLVVNSIACRII